MLFRFLYLIIVLTVLVSISAFNNENQKDKLLYHPYRVRHNGEWYRTFSHMLIHSDTTHLIFNMLSLYFLGNMLEMQFMWEYGIVKGEIHFVILYVMGGLFATLIPFIRNHENPNYRSLGASGAVSAVVFAAILWNPTMKLGILFIPIAIPAYIFGPLYLAFEYWADRRGGTGIAHDAHLGGAVFGILYVLIINIDKGKEFFSQIFG